ncbi:hypothetical protein C0J08_17990 [Marinomonas sp. CT5]|uniref:LysR family transcriptional regulator n=1 Tax=Marinomonas sp. CT5 TaxID=2066133 RepID=UPI001BAECECE|nr:LysR family transcriptional regulator [Marinomonas sp. CT5]QUX97165.1 hypothetical protein C0J08_17990 [Marinomonas sp. CT5]
MQVVDLVSVPQFSDQRICYLSRSHKLGSIRAAADELGMAPSSLSRQISKLEEDFNVELVARGGRSIKLTTAGLMLVDYYDLRLIELRKLMNQINNLRDIGLGSIVIALGDGLIDSKIIMRINDVFSKYKDVKIEIMVASSREIQEMILEDRVHIGLVFSPENRTDFILHHKFNQPLKFITKTGSDLADKKSISIEDFINTPLILLDKKSNARIVSDRICKKFGIDLEPTITANSVQFVRDFVKNGKANTILLDLPFMEDINEGNIVSIPIVEDGFDDTELKIISRRGNNLSAVSKDIVFFLARLVSDVCYGNINKIYK